MIDFVRALEASRDFGPDLVRVRSFPAVPARYAELAEPLPSPLNAALASQKIRSLYSHQVEAIAGTASGVRLRDDDAEGGGQADPSESDAGDPDDR